MRVHSRMHFPSYHRLALALSLLAPCFASNGSDLLVDGIELHDGRAEIRFTAQCNSYYILWRGETIDAIQTAVNLAMGEDSGGSLSDSNSLSGARFYRIEEVPLLSPHDLDGDGIDDVWELTYRQPGAALRAGDAEEDQDGNGTPDRLDYLRHTLMPGRPRSRPVIGLGDGHTLALKKDGSLWAWGDNLRGELGIGGTVSDTNIPIRAGLETNWVSVAAGSGWSFGLKADGTLWAWGQNSRGELGVGFTNDVSSPIQVGSDGDWVTISSPLAQGGPGPWGIKKDGTLWAWNIGGTNGPSLVNTNQTWLVVSAGGLAIQCDGSLWSVSPTAQSRIGTDHDWAAVSFGGLHVLALKKGGSLWSWRGVNSNDNGELGRTGDPLSPGQVGTETNWAAVSGGIYYSAAIKSDGTLWTWGANIGGRLGYSDVLRTNVPTRVGTASNWVAVSASYYETIALNENGELFGFGQNVFGQLGNGVIGSMKIPFQIGSDSDWQTAAAGSVHVVALKNGGTLWTWGGNFYGMLGIGSYENTYVPTQVGSDNDWLTAAAGNSHSLATKTDGSLWSWGKNQMGTLGDGTQISTNAPVRAGLLASDWAAVSAGTEHSLGLKRDGTLWSWGRNSYGELGLGTLFDIHTSPAQVGTRTNWTAIAAGYYNALALQGAVMWGWGQNQVGELGNISNMSSIPVQMGFQFDWAFVAIARSFYPHSVAVKKNGSLWAWGGNTYGELGTGSTAFTSNPTKIGTETNWLNAAVGENHSLGLRKDGTLWAWGSDFHGQCGFGSRTDTNVPIQIGTETNWKSVSAGLEFTVAVKNDGTLWAWGDNSFGQAGQFAIWGVARVVGDNFGLPPK